MNKINFIYLCIITTMADVKGRASIDQMIALNGFLKLDPQLLSGKFSASFTIKTAQKRWEEIANAINAMPGAVKDWKKWRKVSNLCLYCIFR